MENVIRTVHYLGSKTRLLEPIKKCIEELNPTNGRICDLFCGSAVVSEYMLNYYDVLAVDIQNYSKVYCEARLTGGDSSINSKKIKEEIENSQIREKFRAEFSPLIEYENYCMELIKKGEMVPLFEIIEKGSLYSYLIKEPYSAQAMSSELEQTFNTVACNIKGNEDSKETIITRYYGGLYFSFKQAVDIDAIAAFAFSKEEPLKSKVLAALMGAMTDVVNTVGKQFAQPLKVTNKDGTLKKNLVNKIIADRSMDVLQHFGDWLEYYISRPEGKHEFQIVCKDYVEALKDLKPGEVEVIYADPPYTRYHYSRYYHILETLCLRDNPIISTTFPNGKGGISRAIYRNDRHQSPFCIKSQAKDAFEKLFFYARKADASMVLSYSPFDKESGATPRLMTIEEITRIAAKFYTDVKTVSPGQFMHSRFNKQDNNYKINRDAEMLIICKK